MSESAAAADTHRSSIVNDGTDEYESDEDDDDHEEDDDDGGSGCGFSCLSICDRMHLFVAHSRRFDGMVANSAAASSLKLSNLSTGDNDGRKVVRLPASEELLPSMPLISIKLSASSSYSSLASSSADSAAAANPWSAPLLLTRSKTQRRRRARCLACGAALMLVVAAAIAALCAAAAVINGQTTAAVSDVRAAVVDARDAYSVVAGASETVRVCMCVCAWVGEGFQRSPALCVSLFISLSVLFLCLSLSHSFTPSVFLSPSPKTLSIMFARLLLCSVSADCVLPRSASARTRFTTHRPLCSSAHSPCSSPRNCAASSLAPTVCSSTRPLWARRCGFRYMMLRWCLRERGERRLSLASDNRIATIKRYP
jgi:hypothetical protein